MPSQVFTPPATIAGGRLIPSPASFYLTGEDRLRVQSANSAAGVSLKVQWRMADLSGRTIPTSNDHTPNTDRSIKTQDYEVGVGSLLNLTVFASAGTPVVGQTFVMVQLVRGIGATAIVLGTLLSGYVTTTTALGWPGSPIVGPLDAVPPHRHKVGTLPAAGAEVSETVPAGARWQVMLVHLSFATSATVATRRAFLSVLSLTGKSFQWNPGSNQAAGQSFAYEWGPNMPVIVDASNGISQQPFPDQLTLVATDTIRTVTVGLQADDQYAAPVFDVREWLDI